MNVSSNVITRQEVNFSERIKEFLLEERGINIDEIECMEMPESRDKYNLENVIGNINLIAGRFRTKKEANALVDEFLSIPLP